MILLFGSLTAAGITWLSPKLLEWYASPPVPIGVTCDPAISWALKKLIMFQSVGWLAGAILGIGFYIWIRGGKSKNQSPIIAE